MPIPAGPVPVASGWQPDYILAGCQTRLIQESHFGFFYPIADDGIFRISTTSERDVIWFFVYCYERDTKYVSTFELISSWGSTIKELQFDAFPLESEPTEVQPIVID